MNLTIVVGLLVLIVVVVVVAARNAKGSDAPSSKPNVYYVKKSLFSPAERSFLGVLEVLNYEGVTIASKVRLADVFGIKSGLARGDRQRALNRISAKHVDFLLIQKNDGRPLLGIELDDSSHTAQDRVARDSLVDSVFSCGGLPLLHVTAKAAYDPKAVQREIDEALARHRTTAGSHEVADTRGPNTSLAG